MQAKQQGDIFFYIRTRGRVHEIRELGGGPSAQPAPSHRLGALRDVLLVA